MLVGPHPTQTALYTTDTALIKVSNDLLLAADAGEQSILMLLDRSSAFDTADLRILINCLEKMGWQHRLSSRGYVSVIKSVSFGNADPPLALFAHLCSPGLDFRTHCL